MNSILRWLFKGSVIAILVGVAVLIWAHILTQHGGQAWRVLVVQYNQTAVCGSETRGPGFHWLPENTQCVVETSDAR